MIFYLLQMFLSVIAYRCFRNNRIRYFAVITTIYFLAYFYSGSFDIALPIYFIMIIVGIGIPEKTSFGMSVIAMSIILYSIVGVVFQNAFATMVTLFTRYAYILVFVWFLGVSDEKKKAKTDDYRYVVRLGLLTELIIVALVWIRHGIGARVVTNHQPIGAGIAIGLTVIIGWCYLTGKFSAFETVVYSIISVIVTVLSGTRGYMLLIALPMFIIVIMYILDVPGKGEKMLVRVGGCCIGVALVIVWLLVIDQGETLISILRLDEGLGYRENENMYVREIIARAPWYNKLFGFGFGGNATKVEGFLEAIQAASWNRSYMFSKLLTRTIFHNYWYTILFQQGIIGLILIIGFYIMSFLRICSLKSTLWMKSLLIMMLIGNAVSLTFRITATCSIFEMLVISYFIKMLENENIVNKDI